MSVLLNVSIGGQEIQRLEGEQLKYDLSYKRLKSLFSKFSIVESDESSHGVELLLAGWDDILHNTYVEKACNLLGQMHVSISTITGRCVALADLKLQIEEALQNFKRSKSSGDFFRFKKLFNQYRSLINNQYREIRQVLAAIKLPASSASGIDHRYILRVRTKTVSRNLDDENSFVINIAHVSKKPFLIQKINYNDYTTYRGNHSKFGSLLQKIKTQIQQERKRRAGADHTTI